MLPRENRRRAEQGALLGIRDALEGGSQGDLRLAEADVAAEQSVHGDRAFHVVLDLADTHELVGRFLIFKSGFKVALPLVIAGKGVALDLHTRRVERDQLLGDILDRGLDLGFRALPVAGAETAQLDARVLVRSDVFGDHVQLGDGHIEHVALGIVDLDVILDDPVGVDLADAAENADAVDAVYHVIPGGQLREAVDLLTVLFLAAALFLRARRVHAVGDQEEFLRRQLKAGAQRAGHDRDRAGHRLFKRIGVVGGKAVVLEVPAEVQAA